MPGFISLLTMFQNKCFYETLSPACYISLWNVIKKSNHSKHVSHWQVSLLLDCWFLLLCVTFYLVLKWQKQARIKIQASAVVRKFWCLFLCPFRSLVRSVRNVSFLWTFSVYIVHDLINYSEEYLDTFYGYLKIKFATNKTLWSLLLHIMHECINFFHTFT